MSLGGKTVLLVANSAFTILNFRKELIQKLQDMNCNLVVACPKKCSLMQSDNVESEFTKAGIKFFELSLSRSGVNPLSETALFFGLLKIIKSVKPFVVLNYTIKPTIYGSLAAWIKRVPVISSNITGIGFVFTSKGIKARLLRILISIQYKLALSVNSLIFFQNKDDLALFKDKGLVKRTASNIKVINGSGVNTKVFVVNDRQLKEVRFLFVGRLLKDKGIYELIEATKKIKQNFPNVVVSVAGALDDNPLSLKKSELDSLRANNVIDYLGVIKDMASVYRQHNVFVLPSYREGTPKSTLEAMSMSMAVVTTDAPGCKETVEDGVNGYLTKVGDSESLYQAMYKLVDDLSTVNKFGKASREVAVNKFDVEKVNEIIVSELGSKAELSL
ncbi:glycosyltransferase family 4 protein [Pleionea litopenaei]|uniref:Glycosyltransferase family 4 protein n=1 Tax=Pleionea litopenaei TaxID=3070815 RepID=A0AA51RTP0_9GAMM|nr:glycosyltransferase family 4 protein [Pleionea sp. HL-JVS1]WMS87289.1 glycosyltransferase family 4 protein [Pleionea sp. HL-JVS1]